MDVAHISRRSAIGAVGVAVLGAMALPAQAMSASSTPSTAPLLPLNVLLRAGLSDDRIKQIRDSSAQITIDRDVALAEAHVVFGGINASQLADAKNLRWVQCPSAGVEHYPLDAMTERNIILTNAQGCYGPEIAEHTFGLLFALTRGIAAQARQNAWGFVGRPIELRGLTMGIVGLGGIGREVARRAKAMDMKVIAVDAEPMYGERFAMVDEVTLVDTGLDGLLKQSDVIACCAPDTAKSRGMFGADQFASMKDGSFFINVSRGKLVKTDALVEALKTGKVAGAGLDVTDPEPLPPGHALWSMPNVVITSHIAGKSQFAYERVQNVFTENVLRISRGLPLLNGVDTRKGY